MAADVGSTASFNPPAQTTHTAPAATSPAEPEVAQGSEASVLSGENALLTGNKLEEAVKHICEMGFEKDKVRYLRMSCCLPMVKGILTFGDQIELVLAY